MGLFDRLRGIKDPIDGEYRLVACSSSSGGAVYENCTMDGVVTAPGVPGTAVRHTSLVTPVAKWPQPGRVLPVTIDRNDPTRLKIRWEAVPSNAQLAHALAEQQAAAAPASPAPAGAPTAADGLPAGLPPEAAAMVADIVARARAAGATVTTDVTTSVVGADGRAAPGASGGGLTPAESAQAVSGGAAALGLQPMNARVLAAHRIAVPAGMPDAPGGTWDLTLDVVGPGGTGWSSTTRISFSSAERRATVAAIGRTLPVLADPVRHDRLAIDTTRLG